MKRLLFILCVAAPLIGQPIVGPESRSAPIEALDDYALAPQRDGFVLAWTAAGRLFAGHLDATLNITAPPLVLPLFDSATTAVLPAIATNGTSVLVAWHERGSGHGETAFLALLTPDAQRVVKGPLALNVTQDGPLATSVNGKYVVYTGDLRYVFNENLEAETGEFISRKLGAALTEKGDVATVTESGSGTFDCRTICWPSCPSNPPPCSASSTVKFFVGTDTQSATYPFTVNPGILSSDPFLSSPPVVAPNGDSYAGLARLPGRTDVFVQPFRQITLPIVAHGESALAGNGKDVLLVWTDPLLIGIVVHADGTISAPFVIAYVCFQPKVVSINSNDFAVLYRVDVGGQSEIAGRIVQLQAPRQRGVR